MIKRTLNVMRVVALILVQLPERLKRSLLGKRIVQPIQLASHVAGARHKARIPSEIEQFARDYTLATGCDVLRQVAWDVGQRKSLHQRPINRDILVGVCLERSRDSLPTEAGHVPSEAARSSESRMSNQ